MPSASDKRNSRTTEKALSVLAEFANGPPLIGVVTLAVRTDLSLAVVQRLVNSLRAAGFLEQDPRSKKYRLGVRVLELGAAAARHDRLLKAAKSIMRNINEASRELVFLEVVDRQSWRTSYIHFLDPLEDRPLRLVQHSYLHAGAAGKVLLAYLSPQDINHLLSHVGLPRLTPHTITNARVLREELSRIRKNGYAISRGEVVAGTSGVAAPIHDSSGTVIASLCVSGRDSRLNDDRMAELTKLVVAGASAISLIVAKDDSVADRTTGGRVKQRKFA